MKSTFSPKPSATWAAVVALTRPDGLALGAAMGTAGFAQQGARHGMGGHAQRHRVQSGAHQMRQG